MEEQEKQQDEALVRDSSLVKNAAAVWKMQAFEFVDLLVMFVVGPLVIMSEDEERWMCSGG